MKNVRMVQFWKNWGLIPRLMLAVGIAIVAAGGVQTALLVAEGAAEHSARLAREQRETLAFIAPLVADQALVGEYAAIEQLLKNQVKRGEVDRFTWTDKEGKRIVAQDAPDKLDAPTWFARVAVIEHEEQSIEVTAGGVGYGTLTAAMSPVKAHNRLWQQFVKQLQIVAVTLFLMLQFIWLIFRGNLGTLRMLAEGANRFSRGDHAVRIDSEGAPEVQLAAEAFNNMANNTERLIASLGESTGGRLELSPRYRDVHIPYGLGPEMRILFRTGDAPWASACFGRALGAPDFDADEVFAIPTTDDLRDPERVVAARARDLHQAPISVGEHRRGLVSDRQ